MDAESQEVPLPIVETDAETALGGANPYDRSTPFGAAATWWLALSNLSDRASLDDLVLNPQAWGDYSQAAEGIAEKSITTNVHDCPGHDDIKYVKFIDFGGAEAAQAFEDAQLPDFWVVTVVHPGPLWTVWGLSHGGFPPAEEILR